MKSFRNGMKKGIFAIFAMLVLLTAAVPVYADTEEEKVQVTEQAAESGNDVIGDKAMAAALVVGLAAATGAISMGIAIAKSADSISRQPEAEGKIRTTLMLGLVFIETAIIYALVVAILIIFVM